MMDQKDLNFNLIMNREGKLEQEGFKNWDKQLCSFDIHLSLLLFTNCTYYVSDLQIKY
jgi:hypothetical protein